MREQRFTFGNIPIQEMELRQCIQEPPAQISAARVRKGQRQPEDISLVAVAVRLNFRR